MIDRRRFGQLLCGAALIGLASVSVAQGPPGRDRNNPPPGHGGIPPGQAKKQNDARRPDFRFRDQDRDQFYNHYRSDADRWRGRKRPAFYAGERIAPSYRLQPVPRTYWQGAAPPPPPGYQYGYYEGYVVAYDPTTRIIGDVLDLVSAATRH